MGIETAAAGAILPELLGLGTAAAGTAATAAPAIGAGVAASAAPLTIGAAGGAAAAGGGVGAAMGTLEAANAVGALGGDALGAFISANQGWGTMTAAESMGGFMSALGESPLIQHVQGAASAASAAHPAAPDPVAPNLNMQPAYEMRGANQNPSLLQESNLMLEDGEELTEGLTGLAALGFADGGQVPNRLQQAMPNNIFSRTRESREQAAGLSEGGGGGGVTINIGRTGEPYGAPPPPPQQPQVERLQTGSVPKVPVEGPSMDALAIALKQLIGGFQDGGQVRTGSSDVAAGGKIRGPKSKSGRDNQIIKVAGGEGILPKDVMDVPGVAQLVQSLIQTYHTPVR